MLAKAPPAVPSISDFHPAPSAVLVMAPGVTSGWRFMSRRTASEQATAVGEVQRGVSPPPVPPVWPPPVLAPPLPPSDPEVVVPPAAPPPPSPPEQA